MFGAVRLPVVQVFSGKALPSRPFPDRCRRHGSSFATTGDPSHGEIDVWSPWGPAERAHHDLRGAYPALEPAPGDEELAVLERARPLVPGVPG